MLSRLLPLLLALCALTLVPATPARSAATTAPAAAAPAHAKALAKAERRLTTLRKRRTAACSRSHGRRCRSLESQVRRQSRKVRRLRALTAAPAPAPRPAAPAPRATPPAPGPKNPAPMPAKPPVPAPPTEPPVPAAENHSGPALYVAPGGNDSAAGTAENPLATLTAALARAAGGEHIVLAPGRYSRATDTRQRTATVTVTGPGGGQAIVAGMKVEGGQALRVSGLSFTAGVAVHRARDIAFTDSDFTAPPGSGCLEARAAVRNLSVRNSRIHDCVTGFGAGAGGAIPQSRGLTFEGNRFERFSGDAIQFGQWDDVRIVGNVITGMRDPAETIHNDGVQLTGNVHNVTIAGNRITDSRTQLILIQDAVGPIDGVTVENNLVAIAGAVAIQSQGATNARFVNNTVWRGKNGGLWLREGFAHSGVPRVVPKDTVVIDNVLSSYRRMEGAATRTAAGNVATCASWETAPPGSTCTADPGFVAAGSGDYRLRPGAPARAFGSGLGGLGLDIDGVSRTTPAPGAFA